MLTRDEAKNITDKITGMSKSDGANVYVDENRASHLRFSRNTAATGGAHSNVTVTIASRYGRRRGSVSINQFDDAQLLAAVRRSEEVARLTPEDPEEMEELGP